MKTFSDFPTRVAFREPSKCSLCLQVPSKTSAFLKICNFFFYKKQLNQVLTNWRHRCVCHKSSAYDQESNSINALSMVTAINWRSRTMDTQWNLFLWKSQIFGLWQTIWVGTFWGILGIFCQFINTHFGTVSSLSMFSINLLQKTKLLYPILNLVRKELGI